MSVQETRRETNPFCTGPNSVSRENQSRLTPFRAAEQRSLRVWASQYYLDEQPQQLLDLTVSDE